MWLEEGTDTGTAAHHCHVMRPHKQTVSGPEEGPRADSHPIDVQPQGVLAEALLHDCALEAAAPDHHVGVELLEDCELMVREPFLSSVGEGVGLEEHAPEVGHQEQCSAGVQRRPLLEEVVPDGWMDGMHGWMHRSAG